MTRECRMRMMFWQESFGTQCGGIQTHAEHLLAALRERGHEIGIVTGRPAAAQRESHWHDVPVYRFPFWQVLARAQPGAMLALQREIECLQRAFDPAVIHVNGFGPSALFILRARRARPTPMLVSLHSSNTLNNRRDTLLARLLGSAQWVSACSNALLADVRRCVPAISQRSSVVYNGAPPPRLSPSSLSHARPMLLCLGHLAEHKGFDLAIEAVAALQQRFPTLRLIIAGAGPARGSLDERAVRARIRYAVAFPGLIGRAEVERLIDAATLVVIPSRYETFGMVALEAALGERPVVATRVGGLPEVVVHGETGLLVAPEDSDALADAIGSLLSDPLRAERMGKAGRRRAEVEFGLARQCDAYEEIYRRITVGAPTAQQVETSPCT